MPARGGAFTLIELLVVIAIIAILIGPRRPGYNWRNQPRRRSE